MRLTAGVVERVGGHLGLSRGEGLRLEGGAQIIEVVEDVARREPSLARAEGELDVLDAGGGAERFRDVTLVDPRADLAPTNKGPGYSLSVWCWEDVSPGNPAARSKHVRTSSILVLSNGYWSKRVIGRASEKRRTPAGRTPAARRGRTARRPNMLRELGVQKGFGESRQLCFTIRANNHDFDM